jgi:hypothetical protein
MIITNDAAKAIKHKQQLETMSDEVSDDLKQLIVQFAQTYSDIADLVFDPNSEPKLWFMPLDSNQTKTEAAHYFLLAASLSEYKLSGNPRNIRLLLHHLHDAIGNALYTSSNPEDFKRVMSKFEEKHQLLDRLGEAKNQIPEVLCSVNKFVTQKANRDLIDYANKLLDKGLKPKDLVEQLSYNVRRMNKHHKSKAWIYLRWMVRDTPDLRLFQFEPKDLKIPLTTPQLRVYVALGLSDNENLYFDLNAKNRPQSWWKSTKEFDNDTEKLTRFAQTIFPEDPAKVDFPFFILGTWLEYSDLTPASLEKSMRFFIQKHQELLKPLMRYLTVTHHYNRIGQRIEPGAFSALELDVYDFLRSKQVIFHYEFMEFFLSKENPSLTYKPDFLLPRYTNKGRKVLLEPHGIEANLKEVLNKLSMFRQHYGDYFCLILIVPNNLVETINTLDQNQSSYDFLWKQSDYKIQFDNFSKS